MIPAMMIRMSNHPDYFHDADIRGTTAKAIKRRHSLTQSAIKNSGHFIMRKIESLGGKDGLNLLQRKIWETLLCFHMMPKSRYDSIMEARGDGSPGPVQGWTQLRLAVLSRWLPSFSSEPLAGCITLLSHITSTEGRLVSCQVGPCEAYLALQREKYRPTTLPRRYSMVQDGHAAAGIKYNRREDWDKTVAFRNNHVTKTNIARFALQDIMAEVSNPKNPCRPMVHQLPMFTFLIRYWNQLKSPERRWLQPSDVSWAAQRDHGIRWQPDPSDTEDEELYDLYARYQ
ncbi:hypothetical protein PSTT_00177 [Puccinia striiformis]|uniref:Uncharacterized protein n=1 Tax=Puccinia striiformis TaxID=27350 RepID=A0A2S4W848_9BASI|nr:hypothetical protein PSTT_00177 [Puccinia striiformis]